MAAVVGYSPISSESRVQLLSLLAERPDRTIAELSGATDLHPNTVREHLQRLIDLGFVLHTTEHRTQRGRPRSLYRLATGDAGATSTVVQQKAQAAAARGDLMRTVMPETAVAGMESAALHQLDAVIEHLEETGYDPQLDEQELTVDLSPCQHVPQASAITARCAVHLSLIQTVLAEAGGPFTVEGMRPGCDPRDCVIQLRRREG